MQIHGINKISKEEHMLRKMGVVCLALTLLFAFVQVASAADYVGAAKCKICHKGEAKGKIYETWAASKHAKAFQILLDKKENANPKCLECHVTGYGKASGYGSKGTVDSLLTAIGCESCHGPGSEYQKMAIMKDRTKALAAGLIIPDAKTCVTCHNEKSPTFKGFDFATYWKKIEHHLPAPAAAPTEKKDK